MASAEGGRIEGYGEGCPLSSCRPSIFCVLMCVCILRAVADTVIYTTWPSLGELTIKVLL